MNNRFLSSAIFGTAVFTALSVFAFYFQDGEVVLLIHSAHRWIIGALLGVVFLLLAGFRGALADDRKTALGILYLFLPGAFYFQGREWRFFLFPANVEIGMGFFVIALILLGSQLSARHPRRENSRS